MILKICGITNPEDAAGAVEGGANALGFNFYARSPRYIAPEQAARIATPVGVRRVGVFVNERPGRIEEIARMAALDVAQLHGEEQPEDYPALAVWKAVRVGARFDLSRYDECPAEALLLDGPAADLYGGAGKSFDWRLAGVATRRVILAGGLDGSNVAEAIALVQPWGVDACSRIESAPGQQGSYPDEPVSRGGQGGAMHMTSQPDAGGHFGPYGGRYVPEVLMAPIEELEKAYLEARADEAFQAELADLLRNFAGRPTPLYFAAAARPMPWAARASGSSARTCCTPARTRSTTAWGRRCWRGAWASGASSPRPAPASTAWPPPRSARCWASSAWSTWARRTCGGSG